MNAMVIVCSVFLGARLGVAYPSMWWGQWKPDGGCSPPEPGDFIMGNTAENGTGKMSLKNLKGDSVEAYALDSSYVLELSSISSGHLLHVSSGQLSSPSVGGMLNCAGRSAAWNSQAAERTVTWTPDAGTQGLVITLAAAEEYLPVGISQLTLNALENEEDKSQQNIPSGSQAQAKDETADPSSLLFP
mmetsp:Transcript_15454/g.27086  ORF Transcript_15454/g.27086 Transcript_15454/m.27086 type:complete len:188 (+) Transcript_15454:62-625(+)|eukprot:CAMPEP_0197653316 /NCGR_PEP_ID=MMETSP1338-20131121/34979_1 /TAXON_ID=43686 ORGANISM="Pelagodinium beii, Strain RCC1491" /NCGR_SAMPLE_ID=MMETSP1338 /ASSEMBLY_ACC=CAM_ASM_000754 /LENGTH=187 /DNA_ID=CAMNT_0043228371 /DNA_START=62 /DNA_END=625 /DNA_ORIENTATION=+